MESAISDNTTIKTRSRNSGIDLLRIIALLLICFSHATQTLREFYTFETYSATNLVTIGFTPFGTIGNILFVICSAYFLVDKTKSRSEKALNILFDFILISSAIMIGFLISGRKLDFPTIMQQIFPFGLNWFVPCYVIFYLLAPVVVFGLKHFNKKQHFFFTIFALLVYGVLSLFDFAPVGSNLLQFFYILNLVAFIKWHIPNIYHHRKGNLIIFIIGIIICYSLYFLFNLLAVNNQSFGIVNLMQMYSPLLVLPLIALFNVFASMKFDNRLISYLSQCSLLVYVIHENFLLRSISRVDYYNWAFSTFGDSLALVYMLLCGLVMFVGSFLLAVIYKESLAKLTTWFAKKTTNLMTRFLTFVYYKTFGKNESSN